MPREPLTYTQRYQILAGRNAFADFSRRQQAINEGTIINLSAFSPNNDASIMVYLNEGESLTTGTELAEYLGETAPPRDPASVPQAPLSLCVIPRNSSLTIFFLQGSDGGSPITNYSYSTDGESFTPFDPAQTSTPLTVSGLTNGIVYTIYLKAINAIGPSLASSPITAAPIPSSFNPASIAGLNVWLDAQNTSNVILTGSNVSAWNDSSPAENNFTAGPSGIITYDQPSTINNRPAISFSTGNPTSTYLSKEFNISPELNELTLFMVVTQTATIPGNSELFFTRNNYRYFDVFNNTVNGLLSLNIGNATQLNSTVDIITTPPTISLITVLISSEAYMYVNGRITAINGALRGVFPLDDILEWSVSGGAFLGSIGEVITYPMAITDTQRQKVEAYLAWKWGIQSELPSTNPWQQTPPTSNVAPGPPTLITILPGNEIAYIYYTEGTGTPVNYQYTMNAGSTYTSFNPSDTVPPNAITGLTNGTPISVQFRSYNGGGPSTISNSLTATPSEPDLPEPWLLFDPNDSTSYSGSGTLNNIGSFGALSGTVNGAVTYITGTGISGKVLNFNGGYVSFPSFNFGSAFTISAWVNPSAKFSINGILTNGFANANTAGFKFGWNGWQTSNYIMLFENGDGTPGNWYVPSSLINTVIPGVWQMLTVIFDRTARTAIFLRNGVPVGVYDITTASNMTVTGAFNIGAYMGGSYTMKAQLGLLKVYNSALTASQVYDDFVAEGTSFGFPGLPVAPTLSATPSDSSLSITLSEGLTGGSPITNYSYSTDGITFIPFSPPQTTSPITITGLSNGASYTVYIKSITAIGTSPSATSVSVTIPATVPSVPTSISATPADSSLSISFIQGSTGGSPITNYSYSTDGITFTPFSPPQTSSPVTVSGLTNGIPSTVYLKAINAVGTGTTSVPVTNTPATPPSAPASLSATPGNSSISISFTEGSTGGSAITNYAYSFNGTTFIPFDPPQTTPPITIGGLTNGTPYTVYVKAINAAGIGIASTAVTTTPVTLPSVPASLSATPGNSSLSIAFTQGSTGGSPITNYSYSTDGITFTPFSPPQTSSPVTVSGLTNGTPSTVYLKAITAVGTGAASAAVTNTPAIPPTAPASLSATPGNSSISISFTQGSTGGIPITNYSYSFNGTTFIPFDPPQTTSPITIGGLTNGTPYTVYVKAINAVGTGLASAAVTTTPVTLPSVPASLSATPGDSSLSIAFTQGSTGGSPITNYSYSTDGITFTPFSPPQTSSPVTVSGLTNGTPSTVYLKAITAVGTGAASAAVTNTPEAPPLVIQSWLTIDPMAGSYNNNFTYTPGTIGSISPFLQQIGFRANYPFPGFPYLMNAGGTHIQLNSPRIMYNPGGVYTFPGTSYPTLPLIGGNPFFLVDVNLPSSPVNVPTSLTISAWLNPNTFGVSNVIFSTGAFNNVTNASIPPYKGLIFGWDNNTYRLFCATGDGVVPTTGNYRITYSSNNAVTPGVMQNLTLVFDGVNNVSQFYVNGVALGSSSPTASNIAAYNLSQTYDVIIGQTDGPYSMSISAYIGRIKVFGTALTSAQITSYYRTDKVPFIE